MPNEPFISGITDPKQLAAFKKVLRASGVPADVKQIYVVNPVEMQKAQNVFGVQGGVKQHPAFSLYSVGRVYVPENMIGNDDLTKKYLLHEFGHFAAGAYPKQGDQSSLTPEQSMNMESKANKAAKPYQERLDEYAKNRESRDKLYDLQDKTAAESSQFQTTPAPIQTQLVSPNSSATLTAPYKGSVQSVLDRAPQTTYAQRVMASKPSQSYADKVMSQSPNQNNKG